MNPYTYILTQKYVSIQHATIYYMTMVNGCINP